MVVNNMIVSVGFIVVYAIYDNDVWKTVIAKAFVAAFEVI